MTLLTSEEKLKVEIFLEETDKVPLPNWENPSDRDIEKIMFTREFLEDFDDNPILAAKNWKHALEKALDARQKVFARRKKEEGLPPEPNINDFGGDEEAMNTFFDSINKEADIVGEKVFGFYCPLTRSPETGNPIFISDPQEL